MMKKSNLIACSGFAILAVVGLVISLPHLASQIALLTGSGMVASWSLAIVIDAGMVALKASLSHKTTNHKVAWATLVCCTMLSMVLNSNAFLEHSTTVFGRIMAVVFGVFVPAFILVMGYSATRYLSKAQHTVSRGKVALKTRRKAG